MKQSLIFLLVWKVKNDEWSKRMITNERISSYIDSLEIELPEHLKKIEKEALANYVPIIKRPTRSLLRFLIHLYRPKKILEVGTAVGFSALLMSEYIPEECKITTIERIPKRIEEAKKNIMENKKEEVITILEGDAADILVDLVNKGEQYDMIFMDAAKGQYPHFLPYIMNMLPKGGILISDNVLQDGDIVESRYAVTRRNRTIHFRMREYLYQLTHMEGMDTIVMPIGDGVTLSTRL